jgi:hypothetical protein
MNSLEEARAKLKQETQGNRSLAHCHGQAFRGLASQHLELMSKHEDFGLQRPATEPARSKRPRLARQDPSSPGKLQPIRSCSPNVLGLR